MLETIIKSEPFLGLVTIVVLYGLSRLFVLFFPKTYYIEKPEKKKRTN